MRQLKSTYSYINYNETTVSLKKKKKGVKNPNQLGEHKNMPALTHQLPGTCYRKNSYYKSSINW